MQGTRREASSTRQDIRLTHKERLGNGGERGVRLGFGRIHAASTIATGERMMMILVMTTASSRGAGAIDAAASSGDGRQGVCRRRDEDWDVVLVGHVGCLQVTHNEPTSHIHSST